MQPLQVIVQKYIDHIKKDPTHRYRSWDNCFTAFSENNNIELLALHLGFYLASWGMYRGSSGLLQKSHSVHKGSAQILKQKKFKDLKCSGVNEVTIESIPLILELKKELANYYKGISFFKKKQNNPISDTDTLLSKILLGTMGCTPAFDRYFIVGSKQKGLIASKFNEPSLARLFKFAKDNRSEIKKSQKTIKNQINCHYPSMKILDIYFWQIGFDVESKSL